MEDRVTAFYVAFAGGAVQAIVAASVAISYMLDNANRWGIMFWANLGVSPQVLVGSGLVLGFLVLAGAFLIGRSSKIVLGSAIVIIFSLASLVFNGGGVIIGTILGVIGGAYAYGSTRPDY